MKTSITVVMPIFLNASGVQAQFLQVERIWKAECAVTKDIPEAASTHN